MSPIETSSSSRISAYNSVSCSITISADIVTFGLSIPASNCSSHFSFNALFSSSCVLQITIPFSSSSSAASAFIFTSSNVITPYFIVGYLSSSGESTHGSFPSIMYPLYAFGTILVMTSLVSISSCSPFSAMFFPYKTCTP